MDRIRVQIRQFKSDDHDDVQRIFSQGITEHIPDAILLGLKKRQCQITLAVIFLLGSMIWNGFIGSLVLALAVCGQAGIVFSKIYRHQHFFQEIQIISHDCHARHF